MFVGMDLYGFKESGTTFQTTVGYNECTQIEFYKGLLDNVYIDENLLFEFKEDKPTEWNYSTVVHAKFENTLEAGNISGQGYSIQKLRIQKRKKDSYEWVNVEEIPYVKNQTDYEFVDKYVENEESYIYSLVPIAANILGARILSNEIKTEFEGVFLSDKDNNYKLLYDIEYGSITHNVNSNVFESPDCKYPIVAYSSIDYISFPINATFVTVSSENGDVDIRAEKIARENLLKFIKNGKPKVYKDSKGECRIISITDKPTETPISVEGISKLSFNAVEIGDISNNEHLENFDLIKIMR